MPFQARHASAFATKVCGCRQVLAALKIGVGVGIVRGALASSLHVEVASSWQFLTLASVQLSSRLPCAHCHRDQAFGQVTVTACHAA